MKITAIILASVLLLCRANATDYRLLSPDKKIEATISAGKEGIGFTVTGNGYLLLDKSPVDMVIDNGSAGAGATVSKTSRRTVNTVIIPEVKVKTGQIVENYNELAIDFKGNYSLIVRAYDNGVAYRFKTGFKKDVVVQDEILTLNLPEASQGYLMVEKTFASMYEWPYVQAVSDYEEGTLFSLPCLFKVPNGPFLLVTESDLDDYPGLWMIRKNGKIRGTLPPKVLQTKEGNCTSERTVTERAGYLAETKGSREYPWRIFIVADSEKELLTNQLVYLLGKPAAKGDYSWIKPGMATLDWWGRRNIFGTDFKGGVNTATQEYFVDFNHRYGLQYFVLDDGWSESCNLRNTNRNIDLDRLKAYAAGKNTGLVYWVQAYALKQDVTGYLDFLKSKGAAGIKVDFFIRDDQDAINLIHDIAREALKRQLIVDFHGVCKPFGLMRTYPNVLTGEGLIEFEMNGVTDWANPVHHTMLPFIRMVAGPMDYLPGTFNNAQKSEFHQNINRPAGLGTRAHAMALNVIFESPLTMIPDSPADYLVEDECTRFLTGIPVVWDEIKAIDGKIGEYVVLARRSGNQWYLAAITNWDKRNIRVKLDFLNDGNYVLECVKDGANSDTRAKDYKKERTTVTKNTVVDINMVAGGGWVGKFVHD